MVSSPLKTQDLTSPGSSSAIAANLIELTEAQVKRSQFTEQSTPLIREAPNFALGSLSLPDRLFGTDGIRGRAGDLLTAPLALQVGFWAGRVLQAHTAQMGAVVIGQDSRNSSSMLAMALSAVASAITILVVLIDRRKLSGAKVEAAVSAA